VGGELGKEVELKEIQKLWNRMTASNLLGMEFNYKYPTAAKEQGWVDTKRKGFYSLCPDWGNALEGE
jgi:hypothetical protein